MQINDVFRDRKRGWGWKKAPPKGSFLLYKQNYISSVGRVFDMLNNLHVWVFVKWELKEFKLGVKESQVSGIWKKFRIKEPLPVLVISKKPHRTVGFHKNPEKNCWVSQKPGKEEPGRFLIGYFTFTNQLNSQTDRPATSPASPSPTPQNPCHRLSELIY